MLLSPFDLAPVDRNVLAAALSLDFQDYEDAVLREAGRRADAADIVTRSRKGTLKL